MCRTTRPASGALMKTNLHHRVTSMTSLGSKNLRRTPKVLFVLFLVHGTFYIKGHVYYASLRLF